MIERNNMAQRSMHGLLVPAILFFATAAGQNMESYAQDVTESTPPGAEQPLEVTEGDPMTQPAEADPLVLGLLETNPETPLDLITTIDLLIRMGRADAGEPLLEELMALPLEERELAKLVDDVGPAVFLRLALAEELAPQGKVFADNTTTIAAAFARRPERLQRLISDLSDADADTRYLAVRELRRIGEPASAAMVNALVKEERQEVKRGIAVALAALGSASADPLVAVLQSEEPSHALMAMELLGRTGERTSAIYFFDKVVGANVPSPVQSFAINACRRLLGAVPSRDEALQLLRKELHDSNRQIKDHSPTPEERHIWDWDHVEQKVQGFDVSVQSALALRAARLAKQIYAVTGDPADFSTYLVMRLELQPIAEESLHELSGVQDSSTSTLDNVLRSALENHMDNAALAAIELIRASGSHSHLIDSSGQLSPLPAALRSPNRNVRFAALRAVVQGESSVPFPGSSRVPESLANFSSSRGKRLVLISGIAGGVAGNIAGWLGNVGYDVQPASNGKELVRSGQSEADCELIILGMSASELPTAEVVRALRRDFRTSRLPIILLADLAAWDRAVRLAENDERTIVSAIPHSGESLYAPIERLAFLSERASGLPGERLAQATQALEWATQLAANGSYLAQLYRHEREFQSALIVPEVSVPAAELLAYFGTTASQRMLSTTASQPVFPPEVRNSAARSLEESVQRFGWLMPENERIAP